MKIVKKIDFSRPDFRCTSSGFDMYWIEKILFFPEKDSFTLEEIREIFIEMEKMEKINASIR